MNLIEIDGKYYFPSTSIKVFPCAYRGYDRRNTRYNPESVLFTEYNFTNLSASSEFSSYIKSAPTGTNSGTLTFVINGYYFEVSNISVSVLEKYKYACIKLVYEKIGTSETVSQKRLASFTGERASLDLNEAFTGLWLASEIPTTDTVAAYLQLTEDGAWCQASMLPTKVTHGQTKDSVLIGTGLTTDVEEQVAIGKLNDIDTTTIMTNKPTIIVGAGTSSENKKTVVAIANDEVAINASVIDLANTAGDGNTINIKDESLAIIESTDTDTKLITIDKDTTTINNALTVNNTLNINADSIIADGNILYTNKIISSKTGTYVSEIDLAEATDDGRQYVKVTPAVNTATIWSEAADLNLVSGTEDKAINFYVDSDSAGGEKVNRTLVATIQKDSTIIYAAPSATGNKTPATLYLKGSAKKTINRTNTAIISTYPDDINETGSKLTIGVTDSSSWNDSTEGTKKVFISMAQGTEQETGYLFGIAAKATTDQDSIDTSFRWNDPFAIANDTANTIHLGSPVVVNNGSFIVNAYGDDDATSQETKFTVDANKDELISELPSTFNNGIILPTNGQIHSVDTKNAITLQDPNNSMLFYTNNTDSTADFEIANETVTIPTKSKLKTTQINAGTKYIYTLKVTPYSLSTSLKKDLVLYINSNIEYNYSINGKVESITDSATLKNVEQIITKAITSYTQAGALGLPATFGTQNIWIYEKTTKIGSLSFSYAGRTAAGTDIIYLKPTSGTYNTIYTIYTDSTTYDRYNYITWSKSGNINLDINSHNISLNAQDICLNSPLISLPGTVNTGDLSSTSLTTGAITASKGIITTQDISVYSTTASRVMAYIDTTGNMTLNGTLTIEDTVISNESITANNVNITNNSDKLSGGSNNDWINTYWYYGGTDPEEKDVPSGTTTLYYCIFGQFMLVFGQFTHKVEKDYGLKLSLYTNNTNSKLYGYTVKSVTANARRTITTSLSGNNYGAAIVSISKVTTGATDVVIATDDDNLSEGAYVTMLLMKS